MLQYIWAWILHNKEWVFSGIGVPVVYGLFRIRRWVAQRNSLKISVCQPTISPKRFFRVKGDTDGRISVTSVVIWLNFKIYNTSNEPELISAIQVHSEGGAPRPLMVPFFGHAELSYESAITDRHFELPLTLGPKEGRDFFALAEIPVAEKLRRYLFELYGTPQAAVSLRQRLKAAVKVAPKVKTTLQNLVPTIGVELTTFGIKGINVFSSAAEDLLTGPGLGTIPQGAFLTILKRIPESEHDLVRPGENGSFRVDIQQNVKKTISLEIPTEGRALWFL